VAGISGPVITGGIVAPVLKVAGNYFVRVSMKDFKSRKISDF